MARPFLPFEVGLRQRFLHKPSQERSLQTQGSRRSGLQWQAMGEDLLASSGKIKWHWGGLGLQLFSWWTDMTRCWFLVQGCWGGKRLRVEACFDMLFRYSVIQYKSRTLFGQLYLTMVPNHRFGRRLTGMYGNHPKGETTWNLQLQWNIIEISSSAKWSEQEANSTSCRFVEGFFLIFWGGGAWVFSFRCHHLHIIYVVKIRLVYQARDELWHATLGRWDGDGLRSARLFLIGGFAFQPAESLATQAISHWGCFILDSF